MTKICCEQMATLREELARANDGRLAVERTAAELRARVQDLRTCAAAVDAARNKVNIGSVGL